MKPRIYINKDFEIERREWRFEAIFRLENGPKELPIPFNQEMLGEVYELFFYYKENSEESDKDFYKKINIALVKLKEHCEEKLEAYRELLFNRSNSNETKN